MKKGHNPMKKGRSVQKSDFKSAARARAHERARVSRPPPAAPGSSRRVARPRRSRRGRHAASSRLGSSVRCLLSELLRTPPRRVKSYGCGTGRTDGLAYGPHVHVTYSGLQRLHAQRSPPRDSGTARRGPRASPAASTAALTAVTHTPTTYATLHMSCTAEVPDPVLSC